MIKRTCDRCGMVLGPESSISAVRNKELNVAMFIFGEGFVDVDLCALCQDDVYEFIFHKKNTNGEDGEE